MSDHDIRTLLRDIAGEVHDVRPLSHKALRRTRTRRFAIATAVVTSVLTIAVGGSGLALSSGVFGDERVVSPVSPQDSTPPPPRPMPGTIVGYGTSEDGHEWWLSAYENDAGMLCVDLQHDTGDMTEDCEYYDPEGIGIGRDPEAGGGPKNVFGWVPGDTGKLWVTWAAEVSYGGPEDEAPEDEDDGVSTGEADESGSNEDASDGEPGDGPPGLIEVRGDEEVALFDAPGGFPFPVKFYALVPAPEDAGALRIDLRNGDASVTIFSSAAEAFAEEPQFVGELVAEGEHGGYPWELYARTSAEKRCLDLVWAEEEFVSGGSCSTAVPRAESFQYSQLRFGDKHSLTVAFFAAMTRDVARMELTLEEGETLAVEILEGPEGSEVNYAVEWPPPGEDGVLRGSVTSYDEAGNVLDMMELCELTEPNSGCGSDSPPP